MEANFHPEAFECRPNQVDVTLHVSILDKAGNCVQVMPLACNGVCFPYKLDDLVLEIVRQVNGRIQNVENRQPVGTPPPGVSE
jgi:hypothetical protein